ncbi:MAG: DUF5683 domain-containing protein [Balneolales bacterium]|nr:DUF5683 domain-containing protein [Balneolales bacterium]
MQALMMFNTLFVTSCVLLSTTFGVDTAYAQNSGTAVIASATQPANLNQAPEWNSLNTAEKGINGEFNRSRSIWADYLPAENSRDMSGSETTFGHGSHHLALRPEQFLPDANDGFYAENIGLNRHELASIMLPEEMRASSQPRFMRTIAETPGLAFLSSAIFPGLGQAANEQWWKTAIFAGIEISAIYFAVDQRRKGNRLQDKYNRYADDHWSVVQYANFLVRYSQLDISISDMLTERGLEELMNNGFVRPRFNNDIDWAMIDLQKLNDIEFATIYRSTNRPFSHVVPAYGSQQYYELPSKYFQYGPGWRDWNGDITIIDGQIGDMPASWRYHALLEEEFNDALRYSRNFVTLILANHFFSAFDAYFVSKLRLHHRQIETQASLGPEGNPSLQFTYRF